jgi:hypothetical protein
MRFPARSPDRLHRYDDDPCPVLRALRVLLGEVELRPLEAAKRRES